MIISRVILVLVKKIITLSVYLILSVRIPCLYTSVVDPHWFHVDPDPHLAFFFNADPDPVFDDQ